MGKNDIYIVQRPFVTNGRTFVSRGTRMRGDDPRYTDDVRLMTRADAGIEQATAAPGEKRSLSRPEPTKSDLLEEAKSKGVEVKPYATKSQIAEALDEA